jgi:hypothetical protein
MFMNAEFVDMAYREGMRQKRKKTTPDAVG